MLNKRSDETMAQYEMVREIQNLCRNNQMRDVFFEEVETDDPAEFVRQYLKGNATGITVDYLANGCVTVYASCDNIPQKFIFTPLD